MFVIHKLIARALLVSLSSAAMYSAAAFADAEPQAATTAPAAASIDVAASVARLLADTVTIKAGTLAMGDAQVKNQSPIHNVQIRAFALGKYLITRDDFAAFVQDSGYPANSAWRKPRLQQTGRDPVINVSWSDAQAFAQWLSNKTHKKFRLPSEAEWEYAARAGTTTHYYWGDEVGENHGDCSRCGSRWDGDSTAPVGSFAANAWGLYDMAGNAGEWTQDCFSEDYQHAPTDGAAWVGDGQASGDCKYRVVRGGSWIDPADNMASAFRDPNMPDFRYTNIGFRLARDVE